MRPTPLINLTGSHVTFNNWLYGRMSGVVTIDAGWQVIGIKLDDSRDPTLRAITAARWEITEISRP